MRGLAGALALFLLLPVSALAEPVALILDASGTVTPPVAVFEELDDGAVLDLGKDAVLTISHYHSCQEITLAGGKVVVGDDGLDIEGGEVLARTDRPCPGRAVVDAADLINLAVTLRSMQQPRTMSARPEFVLAGPWGEQFARMDIYGEKGHVTTLPIFGGHVTWPVSQAPLIAGVTYAVVLNGPDVRQQAARIEVADDAQGMTVLQGQ